MILTPRLIMGNHVSLEPIGEQHRAAIRDVLASDPDNWAMQTTCGMGEHFESYWRSMVATPDRISFAVRGNSDGAVIGTSSFLQIDPLHRTLEIGATFYRPEQRGTAVNPETKLLMLTEAFGAGVLRVQFSVNTLNTRSQAAVLKLGATKEGVIRNHRITWTGQKRDTALFSIIADEWPSVRQRLVTRLAGMAALAQPIAG